MDICPVGNEPMFDIMHMRRWQMLMENSFPKELQTAHRGMERNGKSVEPGRVGSSGLGRRHSSAHRGRQPGLRPALVGRLRAVV
ncbi:MAG: hypothetical protein R2854_10385 [Caldilineaceae bacterium]